MNMKKLFAALMALVMVLSFAACGSETAAGKGETTIVGSWTGAMDMTQAMEEMMEASLGVEVPMEDIAMNLTFKFNSDGSLECSVDEKSAEKMVENMIDAVVNVLVETLEAEGVDLEAEGLTEADIREMMEESLSVDDMVESMTESFDDVYYVYKDGVVYTADNLDELKEDPEANSEETWEVKLSGNTLKIIDIVDADGESMNDVIPGVLPMTFKK